MRVPIIVLGIASALVCWIAGAYSWMMAYKNRAMDEPFNAFRKSSFTQIGWAYRTRFSILWLVGFTSIVVVFLITRG